MIIVLIHWYIKPDEVDAFMLKWRDVLEITDCSGLFGEFLSAPTPSSEISHPHKDLNSPTGEFLHFVNVGMWKDMESFDHAVGKLIDDTKDLEPFEVKRRERDFLSPQIGRLGEWFPYGRITDFRQPIA